MEVEDKYIKEFTKIFDELVGKEKLSIDSLETIMLNSIENYKKDLKYHVEDLLKTHVNEKELISKKNKNGKKKDIN